LLNIHFANGSGWYISITWWNNYNGKIEVVSYIMESGIKMTIGVKQYVDVRNEVIT